jgi:predicted RNA-binding Zn ribbon-like protein
MEELRLNPGDYPGSYKLIGGRLSLDFVNTISWPNTDRRHDWLTTPGNVSMWLEAVGLPATEADQSDLTNVNAIRNAVTEMLRPLAHNSQPTLAAGERFNRFLTRAQARRRIDPVNLTWTWKPPKRTSDLLDPVLVDAADLITTNNHDRLKHCPSCDWLFEDHTRNRRRRWCDMADCGSRAKARSYYNRNKT